jgi:hypothetical protein
VGQWGEVGSLMLGRLTVARVQHPTECVMEDSPNVTEVTMGIIEHKMTLRESVKKKFKKMEFSIFDLTPAS